MNSNYLIGTDPELFLIDNTNKIISAINKIPGTKHNPYKPEHLSSGFGLQTDNILVEFNIPPIQQESQLLTNINIMKDYISEYLIKHNYYVNQAYLASAIVEEDQLYDIQALEFGCDPDYSCYTVKQNKPPKLQNPLLRSAGCHWHIGYEKLSIEKGINLIKYLDMYLGIPSILLDKDTNRRSLYGKAGSFRFQPWGVEYRVLSSYFMSSNETISFCYNQISKAIDAYENQQKMIVSEEIFEVINNNNETLANQLINKFNLL